MEPSDETSNYRDLLELAGYTTSVYQTEVIVCVVATLDDAPFARWEEGGTIHDDMPSEDQRWKQLCHNLLSSYREIVATWTPPPTD